MPIDLNQLPIPDWNLKCPNCGYNLRGLPEHRCPECGQTFDMDRIVPTWTRFREPRLTPDTRPFPALGLKCPRCRAALDGLTGPNCTGCGQPINAQALRSSAAWPEVSYDGLSTEMLDKRLIEQEIPHVFVGYATHRDLYFGRTSHPRLHCPADFELEVLDAIATLRRELADLAARGRTEAPCPVCGEPNPGNFEFCWNCRTSLRTSSEDEP